QSTHQHPPAYYRNLRGYLLSHHAIILAGAPQRSGWAPGPRGSFRMSNPSAQIVQKLWSYCNVLRDDGLSYGDYVEQLTYLLFLTMAHERTQPPWSQKPIIPAGQDWPALLQRDGGALEVQYRKTLEALGKQPGM